MTDLKVGSSPLSALDWRYQAESLIEMTARSLSDSAIWHSLRIGKGAIGRNHVSEMPTLRPSDEKRVSRYPSADENG